MATARKYLRGNDRFGLKGLGEARRLQRVVAAISGLSLLLTPTSALASIVDSSGQVLDTGRVSNIYAQQLLNDKLAFNRFKEFKLDAGKIANLYFKQQGGTVEAANLFNLVDSRIDVNGTLNAIKNNTVGGSLYLLSREGLVVGSAGVINAGSLYVATPTASSYESFTKALTRATSGKTSDLTKLGSNVLDKGLAAIPVNASGTISVLGKVNAVDGVTMRAAKIAVGKNVSGETVYGTAKEGAVAGASVKTGVTDFSSLVNTTGTSAGLNGKLTATKSGTGDIELSAYNNFGDNQTAGESWSGAGEATAELTVATGAAVNAAGDAKLSAQAVNNVVVTDYSDVLKEDGTTGGYTYTASDSSTGLFGENVTTTATVAVDGTVEGDHVAISADATNRYVTAKSSQLKDTVATILGAAGIAIDASYAKLKSDASVTVGKNAVVRARTADTITLGESERALTIKANSHVQAAVGGGNDFVDVLKLLTDITMPTILPAAGVAYTDTVNNATVTIGGTLASAGSTAITANADSSVTSTAVANSGNDIMKAGDNLLSVAVNYSSGSNTSNVTIADTAALGTRAGYALAGDVKVASTATNSLKTSATAKASEKGDVITAVNVTKYNSAATTNVNSSIRSGKSVAIDSTNTVTENKVKASNSIGTSGLRLTLYNMYRNSNTVNAIKNSISDDNGLISKIKNKVKNWGSGEAGAQNADGGASNLQNHYWWDQLSSLFALGVSVDYANESFKSAVNINPGLTISAGGALNVNATTNIIDTYMSASGGTSNNASATTDITGKKDEGTNNNALVNAAVLYAAMDDDATVTIAGADAGRGATLQGNSVNIGASSTFSYNRWNSLLDKMTDMLKELDLAFTKDATLKAKYEAQAKAVDEAKASVQKLIDSADASGMTIDDIVTSQEYATLAEAASKLSTMVDDSSTLISLGRAGADLVGSVISLLTSPGSLMNFYAGSTTGGKKDSAAGDKQASFALAGGATITNLAHNGRVLVGKNANIKATAGEAALKANTSLEDVALAGKLATKTVTGSLTSGATTGVGGNIEISSLNANSLVTVAEGANISASGIKLDAASNINHKNLAVASTEGSKAGIAMMGVYVDGDSNSIVSVDDEAVLTATKDSAAYRDAAKADEWKYNGTVALNATNNTSILAISGTKGSGTAAGIGVGVTIAGLNRYNYAAIADNDYQAAGAGDDDKRTKLQKTIQDKSGLTVAQQKSLLGSTDTKSAGSIRATNVTVDATTTGSIINTAIAGATSSGSDKPQEPTIPKEVTNPNYAKQLVNVLGNAFKSAIVGVQKADDYVGKKINDARDLKTKTHDYLGTSGATEATGSTQQPSLSITGAGSVAVNLLDGDTAALINGANISITKDVSTGMINGIATSAKDSALSIAASGAAALSLKTKLSAENANTTSVAVAGELGMNFVDSEVRSEIANSSITNAAAIKNTAEKTGSIAAAGLSMALASDKGYSSTGGAGAASVSLNEIDSTVYAFMTDNTVTGSGTTITNNAYDNDTQVTGGINLTIAKGGGKSTAAGATVSYATLTNDVQASIVGGTYTGLGTTTVQALTKVTQVGVAAGVSAATGSTSTSTALQGSLAYNRVHNQAIATVEGATMSGTSLYVDAQDSGDRVNAYESYLAERGFDASGTTYLESITGAANEIRGSKDEDGSAITEVKANRSGNTIVTGAVSVAAAKSSAGSGGAAQGAVSISDIDNDYRASVNNSTITMSGVKDSDATTGVAVNAASSTVLAGFAVGSAGSNGGGLTLSGSYTWNTTDNDVNATISNSNIYTPDTRVLATSGATEVNVAGQLGITTGSNALAGAGAALAYNSLNNTTGAYIYGGTLAGLNGATTAVTVDAANADKIYSVGASIVAATDSRALSGVAVVNTGKSDISAVIDKWEETTGSTTETKRSGIKNAASVKVKSSDDSTRVAVTGNVTAAKGASVGGSVAINDIGSISSGTQANTAAIRNTTITTADSGTIAVNATDRAALTTVAVGTSLSREGTIVGSGAGAASLIDKDTTAELSDTDINASVAQAASGVGAVTVGANSENNIKSVGVVLAGSAGNAAAGVGIAVNKITADTLTIADTVNATVQDYTQAATSQNTIKAIGIGGAAAKKAGIAGNIAINIIGSDTISANLGSKIKAADTVAILTNSTDTIGNYGGALGVAAGGSAGVGIAVSYDEISGATTSAVEGSTLVALGTGDGVELMEYSEDKTVAADKGTKKTHKGIVVDATSEHKITGVTLSGGVAASGGVSVGVAGNVAVNKINGGTNATVADTSINDTSESLAAAAVHVGATDRSYANTYVGTVGVGVGSGGAGAVGGSSNTNDINRDVTATVENTTKKALNGSAVEVKALNKAQATTFAGGLAVAVSGAGAGSFAGVVATTLTEATTQAYIANAAVNAGALTIGANHRMDSSLTSAAGAIAASEIGIAGGVGVGVLNDKSTTVASLEDSTVTTDTARGDGTVAVAATNTTVPDAAVAGIGIGIGSAGANIAVNNLNNKVTASVAGSKVKTSGKFSTTAKNTVDTDFRNASVAVAGVALGIGVAVNTVDTGTVAEVTDSTVEAGSITVDATEKLDVDNGVLGVSVGGLGINANVSVTSIGTTLAPSYDSGEEGGRSLDMSSVLSTANSAIDGRDATSTNSSVMNKTFTTFTDKDGQALTTKSAAKATTGTTTGDGVKVAVTNSTLKSAGKIAVSGKRTVDADLAATQASIGGVGIGTSVAVLDVKRNGVVNVSGSTLTSGAIDIASLQDGTSQVNAVQAGVAGASLNIGYASTTLTGANIVTVAGSTLEATGEDGIGVTAQDTSQAQVAVTGGEAGIINGGVIVAKATNTSDTTVNVNSSTLNAGSTGAVSVLAQKENTVKATSRGGAFGAGVIQAIVAKATDSGSGNLTLAGVNNIKGDNIILQADNSPAVEAGAYSYAGTIAGSNGAAVAHARATGYTNLTIGSGSTLTADSIYIFGTSYEQWAEDSSRADGGYSIANVTAKVSGNSISGLFSTQSNVATAISSTTVNVNVGETTYNTDSLTIAGINSAQVLADAYSLNIGGIFAVGTNTTNTTTTATTTVKAAGATAASSLGAVDISGRSYIDTDNTVDGSGGGVLDISPVAAQANSEVTTNTTVDLSGKWASVGSMKVATVNNDDIDVTADALAAAVIGGSGAQIYNTVNHNALLNVTGTVTSSGEQYYGAENVIDHDVDLKDSGYGAGSFDAAKITNKLTYTARANVTNATLTGTGATGAITVAAATSGNMDYDNIMKSAGIVTNISTTTDNTVTYDNAVNVTGSSLTTSKENQDITIAASDETVVDSYTMADTQGGIVSAASATAKANFTRNNKINIDKGSHLFSTNDVNIYAGAGTDGASSDLELSLTADAYNHTLVPVWTDPTVKNQMYQNNQVTIAGEAESVRHTNIKADTGSTTVATSARKYKLYGGESGKGSVTSTILGDQVSDEKQDNFVNITGSVAAGVHNNLDVTIKGEPKVEASGDTVSVDYSGVTYNPASGSEWATEDAVYSGTVVTVENSLMQRYQELNSLMSQYDAKSSEYQSFAAEQAELEKTMIASGFAARLADGSYVLLDSVTMPAIELSDLVISGGNINIATNSLQGSGKLSASGAGKLSITNETPLYLKVGDLAIKDKGGTITYNNATAGSGIAGFSGSITSSAVNTDSPTITIRSTGTHDNYTRADIGIFGRITNSAGDVNISNANNSITVHSDANITARNVAISADKGSITQNSDGNFFVGANPIMKYYISDSIAKKVQQWRSRQAENYNIRDFSKLTYEAYKEWLLGSAYQLGLTSDEVTAIKNYKVDPTAGSIVAGQNIYINAKNVNLDGIVQSGFQNYNVTLDATAQQKVAALDASYAKNTVALSDHDVMSDASGRYCITTDGGKVYNEKTGQYDYNVKVYYNPATGELLTEEIEPSGGKIYITGAISSTGSGKILAMNGTPNISIDTTAVDKALQVNSITNQNIAGLIRIADTQKKTVTEYTTDGEKITTKTSAMSAQDISTVDGATSYVEVDKSAGSGGHIISTTYTPDSNMAISWTGGTSGDKVIKSKQYTKAFHLWGLIKCDKTEEFVARSDVASGQVTLNTNTSKAGDTLGTGIVIGTKNLGNLAYKTTTSVQQGTTTYSKTIVKSKYKNWRYAMIGEGTAYYNWTETTGASTSTTYSIKANSPISVGFLSGSTGDISITAKNNIDIAGNIKNAVATDGSAIGSLTLTSKAGSVNAIGDARLDADSLTLSAERGIDVNHGSIAGTSTIAISSTDGDVKLTSDKGDLVFTGASGAADGNFAITSDGSITTATGASLNGTRIDLVSNGSSINALVAAGTSVVNGDSRSASINARANGDITLTNANGDMRLGEIKSLNGDVTLTTSGNFVDAVGDGLLSDSESKVERWQEAGLISAEDDPTSRAAAAAAAKKERLDALEAAGLRVAKTTGKTMATYKSTATTYYNDSTITAARETYIAAVNAAEGDTAAIETATSTYQAAQKAYFSGKGFTNAEQEWIATYADVAGSNEYGWSQTDLLYAVQESVINSEPGQVYTTDTPNIVGKNITLNAGSSIGVDGEQVDIAYADLTKLANLKILAGSKAGDLTWNDEAQIVSVRQQQPVTVKLAEGGRLSMNASTTGTVGGNVYLAGVKDTKLDISGTINTTKDVKLLADKGITMADGTIIANNLTIMGGSGDIGSAEKNIETNLSGNVEVNTTGSAYIHQMSIAGEPVNPLTILSIAVGKLYLTADNGIYMTTESGKTAGYINAQEINITAKNGDIGRENDGLRILENGAVINATAENGSIYLIGAGKKGTLTLDNIGAAGEIEVSVNGDLNLGFEAEPEGESGTITAGADSVELAAGGSIAQSESAGGIKSDTITVTTGGAQELKSTGNTATSVTIAGKDGVIGGNAEYSGTAESVTIKPATGTTVNGAITIENSHASGTLNIAGALNSTTGSIDIDSGSSITIGGDITANDGHITIDVNSGGTVTGRDSSLIARDSDSDGDGGNISIRTGGLASGDVDLEEVIASGNASIAVGRGDLGLVRVDGNTIAIKMGEKGSNVDIDTINTERRIDLEGININLDKLESYTDADGTLVYRQRDTMRPLNILTLGDTEAPSGVRFENLWLGDAVLDTGTDSVTFDGLRTYGTVYVVDGSDHITAVWGRAPERDSAVSASYWLRPNATMQLAISGRRQQADGLFLASDGYYRVYGQRYSALDTMLQQLTDDRTYGYRRTFIPQAPHYMRYDLHDYSALITGLSQYRNGDVAVADDSKA